MMNNLYRLNAAAIVFNQEGKVLVFGRVDFKNQWQFPQGGIDKNENHKDAALRELKEETGIHSVKHIAEYPQALRYDFPEDVLEKFKKMGRTNIGQEQYWHLFFFNGSIDEINFTSHPEEVEFKAYKWVDIMSAPKLVVDFKKDVYRKVCSYFQPIIQNYIKN